MNREPDQAAPKNWITLVTDRCDLDLAFEALDGWDHFHTDTIRGRIRSLQLRPDEAWQHFLALWEFAWQTGLKASEGQQRQKALDLERYYQGILKLEAWRKRRGSVS